MRVLILGTVAASLALSVGGVSVRPVAAEPEQPPAAATPVAPGVVEYTPVPAAPADPGSCQVPQRSEGQAVIIKIQRHTAAAEDDYVPVNTRGYNYPAPDDSPDRFVPDSTGRAHPKR